MPKDNPLTTIFDLFKKRRYYNVSYCFEGGFGAVECNCLGVLKTKQAQENIIKKFPDYKNLFVTNVLEMI